MISTQDGEGNIRLLAADAVDVGVQRGGPVQEELGQAVDRADHPPHIRAHRRPEKLEKVRIFF